MSYAIYLQQQNDRNLMKIKHLYERALSQSPNNPTYLASYALFLDGDLNDHTAAKDKFEASLKIDPDNATTLTSFAATLMKSKEEREAGRIEELYRHALEIEPENELTLIAYGQFYNYSTKTSKVPETGIARHYQSIPITRWQPNCLTKQASSHIPKTRLDAGI